MKNEKHQLRHLLEVGNVSLVLLIKYHHIVDMRRAKDGPLVQIVDPLIEGFGNIGIRPIYQHDGFSAVQSHPKADADLLVIERELVQVQVHSERAAIALVPIDNAPAAVLIPNVKRSTLFGLSARMRSQLNETSKTYVAH